MVTASNSLLTYHLLFLLYSSMTNKYVVFYHFFALVLEQSLCSLVPGTTEKNRVHYYFEG
jgi:hypothetical protein